MCVFPSQYGGSDWTGTVIILTHEPCFCWRQESALIQKLLLESIYSNLRSTKWLVKNTNWISTGTRELTAVREKTSP